MSPTADAPVASLPMYDWPEFSDSVDRFWREIADELEESGMRVPDHLDRREAYADVWVEPKLVLSQTCGLPYVRSLRSKVRLVGVPVYDVPGCGEGAYSSVIVVRRDDQVDSIAALRGRRAAINDRHSQSGYSALRAVVAPVAGGERFFSEVIVSGGHRASFRAVAEGAADVAAIDCVSWAFANRHEPATCSRLRVLTQSPSAPALPFITSIGGGAEAPGLILAALQKVVARGTRTYRDELFLAEILPVEDRTYDRVIEIEQHAVDLGYPEVA